MSASAAARSALAFALLASCSRGSTTTTSTSTSTSTKKAPVGLPLTKKMLMNHPELGPLSLVVVPSGDRLVVGVPARDLAHAQAIAKTLEKEGGLSPELSCAQPTPEITVPVSTSDAGP